MNAITIQRLAGGNLIITAPGVQDSIRFEQVGNAIKFLGQAMESLDAHGKTDENFRLIPTRIEDLEKRNANQRDAIERFAAVLGCSATDHSILNAITKLKQDKSELRTVLDCARGLLDCEDDESLNAAIRHALAMNEILRRNQITGVTVKRDAADKITEIIAHDTVEAPGRDMVIIFDDPNAKGADSRATAEHLLEMAWAVISNAPGGAWDKDKYDEWRTAAEKWRDQYHTGQFRAWSNASRFRHELAALLECAPAREEIKAVAGELKEQNASLRSQLDAANYLIRQMREEEDETLCLVCQVTNIGCRNYGEPGHPKWICHSCVKRTLDATNKATAHLLSVM